MIKNLKKIADLLKIKESDLKADIDNDKEVDVQIGEITTFTTEELNTRTKNKEEEAKKFAVSEFVKTKSTEFGIEGDLFKGLQEKYKKEYSKGDSEKIKGFESTIEGLKKVNLNLDTDFNDFKAKTKSDNETREFNNSIVSNIKGETTIDKQDIATIIKSKILKDENGFKNKETGKYYQDSKTFEYHGIDTVVTELASGYLKKEDSGNKDRKDHSSRIKTKGGSLNEFIQQLEAQNISPVSAEGQAAIKNAVADNIITL